MESSGILGSPKMPVKKSDFQNTRFKKRFGVSVGGYVVSWQTMHIQCGTSHWSST